MVGLLAISLLDYEFQNPWYFPSVEEYATILKQAGFKVSDIKLIPRPTLLKSGINTWLEIFTNGITYSLTAREKEIFMAEVAKKLKPLIFSEANGWVADYVRLRFQAFKN